MVTSWQTRKLLLAAVVLLVALLGAVVLPTQHAAAADVLFTEDFETDGNPDRYVPSEDCNANSNFFTRTNSTNLNDGGAYSVTGQQGQWWWAGEDIGSPPCDGNERETVTFQTVNTDGYTNLTAKILIAEDDAADGNEDWNSDDYFKLQYSLDGGSTYQDLICVASSVIGNDPNENSAPYLDADCDGFGEGVEITPQFAEFTQVLPINTASSVRLRAEVRLSNSEEDISFDYIRLEGTPQQTDNVNVSFVTDIGVAGERTSPHVTKVVLNAPAPLSQPVTVNIAPVGGDAVSNEDYTLQTTSVTFPAGSQDGALETVNVSISNDGAAEAREAFVLRLDSINGGVDFGPIRDYTVYLFDNARIERKVYWANGGLSGSGNSVQRANLDGSSPERIYEQFASTPRGLAIDPRNSKIYWTGYSAANLQRANLDGNVREVLISSTGRSLYGLDIDLASDKLYMTDFQQNLLQRVNLDGTGTENIPLRDSNGNVFSLADPTSITVDRVNNRLYLTDFEDILFNFNAPQNIYRGGLDGSNGELLLDADDGVFYPHGPAVDAARGHIYWGETPRVRRADLDGNNATDLFTFGFFNQPREVAIDYVERKIYWGDAGVGTISRANMDGSGIVEVIANVNDGTPGDVVLADVPVGQQVSVAFAVGAASGAEGTATPPQLRVTTNDTQPTGQPITLTLSATSANAAPGVDYQLASTSFVIPANTAHNALIPLSTFTVLDDEEQELNEVVTITLDEVLGGTAVSPLAVAYTITDDDGAPSLVTNGDFATGDTTGWSFFSGLENNFDVNVTDATLQVTRVNATSFALLAQLTGQGIQAGTSLELSANLGNSSDEAKYVLLRMWEFPRAESILECLVTVPANTALQPYTVRGTLPVAVSNLEVQIHLGDYNEPYLLVDDVVARTLDEPVGATECNSPLTPGANMVVNGDFDYFWSEFMFFNSPELGRFWENGVYNITRSQVVTPEGFPIFTLLAQYLFFEAPQGTPLQASVKLGNTSSKPKLVSLHLVDVTNEATRQFCVFTVPPNTPLQTYTMQMLTQTDWSNINVQFFLDDFNEPWLQMDDLEVTYEPDANITGFNCDAPLIQDRNLVHNGDFDYGYIFFGNFGSIIAFADLNGVLNLFSTNPADVALISQPIFYESPAGTAYELTVDLGNPTPTGRFVAVRLFEFPNDQNEIPCVFFVPPNTPLQTYTMRGLTNGDWQNTNLQVFVDSNATTPSILLDNINLQYAPDSDIFTNECLLPGQSPLPSPLAQAAQAADAAEAAPVPAEVVTVEVEEVIIAPVVVDEVTPAPALDGEPVTITEEAPVVAPPAITEEVQVVAPPAVTEAAQTTEPTEAAPAPVITQQAPPADEVTIPVTEEAPATE